LKKLRDAFICVSGHLDRSRAGLGRRRSIADVPAKSDAENLADGPRVLAAVMNPTSSTF
jgi:hypothetical protein